MHIFFKRTLRVILLALVYQCFRGFNEGGISWSSKPDQIKKVPSEQYSDREIDNNEIVLTMSTVVLVKDLVNPV